MYIYCCVYNNYRVLLLFRSFYHNKQKYKRELHGCSYTYYSTKSVRFYKLATFLSSSYSICKYVFYLLLQYINYIMHLNYLVSFMIIQNRHHHAVLGLVIYIYKSKFYFNLSTLFIRTKYKCFVGINQYLRDRGKWLYSNFYWP